MEQDLDALSRGELGRHSGATMGDCDLGLGREAGSSSKGRGLVASFNHGEVML